MSRTARRRVRLSGFQNGSSASPGGKYEYWVACRGARCVRTTRLSVGRSRWKSAWMNAGPARIAGGGRAQGSRAVPLRPRIAPLPAPLAAEPRERRRRVQPDAFAVDRDVVVGVERNVAEAGAVALGPALGLDRALGPRLERPL